VGLRDVDPSARRRGRQQRDEGKQKPNVRSGTSSHAGLFTISRPSRWETTGAHRRMARDPSSCRRLSAEFARPRKSGLKEPRRRPCSRLSASPGTA
jgi:hypothetical protein